jgi:hypothetical protein
VVDRRRKELVMAEATCKVECAKILQRLIEAAAAAGSVLVHRHEALKKRDKGERPTISPEMWESQLKQYEEQVEKDTKAFVKCLLKCKE